MHLNIDDVSVVYPSSDGRPPVSALSKIELEVGNNEFIVALGASVVRLVDQEWGPWGEHYYQMLDPEGNEFCLQ